MILAVGFRVRGVRGTQFRQWANAHLSEYLVNGFTIDGAASSDAVGRGGLNGVVKVVADIPVSGPVAVEVEFDRVPGLHIFMK